MEALGSVGSIIAVVQIAGSVAKLCGGYIADVNDARHDIERLQQKATTLHDILQRLAVENDETNLNPRLLSDNVLNSINQCSHDLRGLQEKLQPKTRHKTMSRLGVRALKWPLSKSSVNEEVKMIEGYLTIFNTALQLGQIAISQNIDLKIDQDRDNQLLKSISYIGDAAYDSYENQRHRPCLADTRVDLLHEISNWATCDSRQYIYWLQGRAGTGKSTIALTIAQSLDKPGAALASFFFKRGGGDLARSRKVISTIAFQFATRSRLIGKFVCDALRESPNLGESASLSQQYDKLLLRPLQQARQSEPHLPSFTVVLDALDECDDINDVRLLLSLFGNPQRMADLGFRVLITSRPENPIRFGFRSMEHVSYHEIALHDVPRAIVDKDIEVFVTYELARIRTERRLAASWPGSDKIWAITSRADGLFIYAATVCRYVNGPWQISASARLEQVCQGSAGKHKSTQELDKMYSMILDSSMRGDFSAHEAEEVGVRLRKVVGTVILLFDNLSAEELARLLFPFEASGGVLVQHTLDLLHAVLDVPEDPSKPIRILHLSFRDFLVDSARCPDLRFQINQQQEHRDLLNHCLDLMERYLRKNICQLSGQGDFIDEIPEAALSQHIPLGLRYACRHWTSHAEQARVYLSDNSPIHNFLRRSWPCWLEVMGLIRKVPEAISMMIQLRSLIEANKAPELHSLVQDFLRFMLNFNYVLAKAPMQGYNTGLIFSPAQSISRKAFSSFHFTDLKARTQLPADWNACIQTLEGHSDQVNTVVLSPDGSRVVSGSSDKTLRVWDTQTGQCQYTLEGHSSFVEDIVFSPDGSQIVSGSDKIMVWDMQTGECQYIFQKYRGRIDCLAFSPDGLRIISGSTDMTVRVWDAQTGQCCYTLEGHLDKVTSVVFSPDGSLVASGSYDKTVRVWGAQTGLCQYTLECSSDVIGVIFSPDDSRIISGSSDGEVRVWDAQTVQCYHRLEHSSYIASLAFSPDGSQVILGSADGTIQVWDVHKGQYQYTLEGHSKMVSSLVFSPDGSRIISGSWDTTVRVWDIQIARSQCLSTFEGHSRSITGVVFSPNGLRVASGSDDGTIRVWDTQTSQCQYTLKGHSGAVFCVIFSPNGLKVASGSYDKAVRIWDIQTAQCQYTLKGHSTSVACVAFSPDGLQVASGSWDRTVRVWDMQTGKCQYTLEGHIRVVTCVAFSPDGLQVASASRDGTIRVWDVQPGHCRAGQSQYILQGSSARVNNLVFSPDGSRLASSSWDDKVRVWDVASVRELVCYDSKTPCPTITFCDDSSMIIVDGTPLSISSRLPSGSTTPRSSSRPRSETPVSMIALSKDWVTLSSRKILWLPPEYRPSHHRPWASYGDILVIGSGTGRVTFVYCGAKHSSSSKQLLPAAKE